MEIENLMTLPEYNYNYQTIPDDIWADMESDDYDDMVFEEISKE